MGTVGEADGSRGAAHLLHRDAMREVAHAGAAICLLDGDAVETKRAHFRPQLDRETIGPVDLGGERRDTIFGKAAHRRAQHVDLRTEIEIEGGKPRVMHGLYLGGRRRLVRSRRLELPRSFPHSDLNAARLPVPPRPHGRAGVISKSGLLYQAAWIFTWTWDRRGSSGGRARFRSITLRRSRKWSSGSPRSATV